MKKRTKRLLAMLLASAMILQQGSTVGVLATESEPASETVAETTAATEAETKAPETQAPETKASETQAPETKAPETQAASETQATEASTSAPQTETATSETTETAAETTEKMTEAAATEATEAPAETEEAPDTEVDTEEATEKADEAKETEAPKTNFTYEDNRVKITAVAQEAAKLPQDAQIHADYMQPGTAAYNEAAAALEAAYAGKDVVLSYVFYDIYFTAASAGDGRIEPEAGTVTVNIQFKQPELTPEADAEVQTYDVVHVENGKAQEVPSTVQTTGDGSVASVGFTSGDFSPYAVVMSAEEQDEVTTIGADEEYGIMPIVVGDELKLEDYVADDNGISVTVTSNGQSIEGQTFAPGQGFEFSMSYKLSDLKKSGLVALGGDTVTLVYDLPPKLDIRGLDAGGNQSLTGPITSNRGNLGTYEIKDGKVYFHITKSFLNSNSGIEGTFKCNFYIKKDQIGNDYDVDLNFLGEADGIHIQFTEPSVSLEKTYGPGKIFQKDGSWYIEYQITVKANDYACNNVVVVDTYGNNLEIVKDSICVDGTKVDATVNGGNSFTLPQMDIPAGGSKVVTYNAKILDPNNLTSEGKLAGVDNKVTWKWKDEGETTHSDRDKEFKPDIYKSTSSKSAGNVSGQKISWTVELNKGDIRSDVSKKVYVDTLKTENQKYVEGSFKIYKDDVDVTAQYQDKLSITDRSFTFTLPEDDGYSSFKITYDTEPKTPLNTGDSLTVTNEGIFMGDKFTGSKDVSTLGEIVKKEAKGDFDQDNLSQTWTVTLTPPSPEGWPDGFDFDDIIANSTGAGWAGAYQGFIFDESSLEVTGEEVEKQGNSHNVTFSKSEGMLKAAPDRTGNDKLHIKFNGTYTALKPITITITTKADAVKANDLTLGAYLQLYNTCWVGNNVSQDIIEHTMALEQHYIQKSGEVENTGDKIKWTITANVEDLNAGGDTGYFDFQGKTVTVTDTLPEGLSYVEGTAKIRRWTENNGRYNNEVKSITPVVSADGRTLTFTVENVGKEAFWIEYETTVDVLEYDKKFINKAKWQTGEENLGGTQGEVTYQKKLLEKKGEVLSDLIPPNEEAQTTIGYTIEVNKNALDYDKKNEYLTLEDVIPDNVELFGDVKITAGGEPVENSGYAYDPKTRVLTVVVPDSLHVTVFYQVKPNLDGLSITGGKYSIHVKNTVSLRGKTQESDSAEANYNVLSSSATLNGNPTSMYIHKFDAQSTGTNLPGATFKLVGISFDASGEVTEEIVDEQTTNEEGLLTFDHLLFNKIYYYQETVAPEGYTLDEKPHYFCYHTEGTLDDEYSKLVSQFNTKFPGVDLDESKGGKQFDVVNSKPSEAEIVAKKTIQNANIKDYTFSFNLQEMEKAGDSFNIKTGGVQRTVTNDTDGNIVFPKISYTEPGTYYYQITEQQTSTHTGVEYDDAVYIVQVDVSNNIVTGGMTVEVTYLNATDGITFVNTLEKTEDKGSLKLTKTVIGADATGKKYQFVVKNTVTGKYYKEDGTASDTEVAVEVPANGSVTIENLPVGSYSVTEKLESAAIANYSLTVSGNGTATATVAADTTAEVTITNTYTQQKGSLTVKKSFEGAENLTPAQKNKITFTVTGPENYSKTFTYGEMTNGAMTLTDLTPGEYTVTESDANVDGYDLTTTYSVDEGKTTTTVPAGGNATVTVTNTYTKQEEGKGSLVVKKSFTGAEKLTVAQKNKITFTVTGPENYSVTFTYADMQNGEKTLTGLMPGEYTVTESEADVVGYDLTTTYSVGEGKTTVTAGHTETVTVTNAYTQKGSLTVRKSFAGAEDLTEEQKNNIVFTVTDPAGKETLFTYAQMENGEKMFENLTPGVYTVKEGNANVDGYSLETKYSVEDGKTTVTAGGSAEVTVTNTYTKLEEGKGSLIIQKNVEVDGVSTESTDADGIYKFEVKNAAGEVKATVEIEIKNGKSGTRRVDNLDPGKYTITEVLKDLKKGMYPMGGYEIPVEVKAEDVARPITVVFVNNLRKIKVDKLDENKNRLPEAKLQIRLKDVATGEPVDSWTSGETAHDVTDKLDPGKTYILEETEAPTGYTVADPIEFTVDENGIVKVNGEAVTGNVLTMEDAKLKLEVNKKAIGSGEELDDAKIEIVDKDGKVVDSWTSKKGETHDFGWALKVGESYTMRETVAPDGYTCVTDMEFTVKADGTVDGLKSIETKDADGNTIYVIEDTLNKISILKVDKNGGAALAGAKLIVKDKDGKVVAGPWTTENKAHDITGIAPGTYTLIELEAPAGYNVAADQTFTVTGTEKADEVIQVEMEDEKTTITNRSLTVTKHLRLDGIEGFEGQIGLKDKTFHVALFSDEEKTQRVSDVKKIEFKNASVSSAVFTNLEADKTYYVGETDENGTLIPAVISEGSNDIWYPEYGSTAQYKFEGNTADAVAEFTNVYIDWSDDFYLAGQLTVTKKVLLNGVEHNSTDTFYARVFRDAALTTPASDVLTLNMAGGSTASATVTNLAIGDTPGSSRSYYVAETDANGVPLNPSAVEFEISVDKSEVVLSAENDSPEVVITNKFTEKEESESETEEEEAESKSESETEVSEKKTAPKTGDDTDFMKYLLLMALSAGTCAVIFDKKRKGSRAER